MAGTSSWLEPLRIKIGPNCWAMFDQAMWLPGKEYMNIPEKLQEYPVKSPLNDL
jgi:hypothetical protein